MKRCEKCEKMEVITTTCKTCFPKGGVRLNTVPGMTITVESDGLASINGKMLKAGVEYYPDVSDVIVSHKRITDEPISAAPGEFHVISDSKDEFNGLMNGNLKEFKPVRYPLDDKGIIDNALINQGGE